MKPYKDMKNVRFGLPGATPGRPIYNDGSAKQFSFPITFGHLEPRIFEHTSMGCTLYTHPNAPAFFGVTEEGPELEQLLRRIRKVLRLHLVGLWRTPRVREEIFEEGNAALKALGDYAAGVQSLVVDMVEQSIKKGGLPPRAEWGKQGTPLQSPEPPSDAIDAIFLLNKRLLHELKGLRAEFAELKAQFTALAGGLASRPQVAPSFQPPPPPTPPAQPTTDDLLRGGPALDPTPPTPSAAPQRPTPLPNPTAAKKLGLTSAPGLPSTKPQTEVHRNTPLDVTRPYDLRGADAVGESLAFDDMKKGR